MERRRIWKCAGKKLGERGRKIFGTREFGEAREMKLWKILSYMTLVVLAPCLFSNGCGGSSGANTITVGLTSSVGNVLILGQSTTLTATVSGSTNTDVTKWTCTCTTTTTNSSGVS